MSPAVQLHRGRLIDHVHLRVAYISRAHLAFPAPDRETVHSFYKAALAAGGKDNGASGERSYHPGYYGAFVFDGPFERSAPSVVVTPK